MRQKIADLLGRLFIGLFFFFEAVDSIVYFRDMKVTLNAYGITWAQDFLIVASIFIVYPFWAEDAGDKTLAITYFSRNMALCGGLLILIANGATGWSVKRILHTLRLPK